MYSSSSPKSRLKLLTPWWCTKVEGKETTAVCIGGSSTEGAHTIFHPTCCTLVRCTFYLPQQSRMDVGRLSQEDQAAYDQLTQEAGDDLVGPAPGTSQRHPAASGDNGRAGGGGGDGGRRGHNTRRGGASERHGPGAPEARQRLQAGARGFRGNGGDRGGGSSAGGGGGPATAAAAVAGARAKLRGDEPIKDVVAAHLKDLLCADNRERFRRVSPMAVFFCCVSSPLAVSHESRSAGFFSAAGSIKAS